MDFDPTSTEHCTVTDETTHNFRLKKSIKSVSPVTWPYPSPWYDRNNRFRALDPISAATWNPTDAMEFIRPNSLEFLTILNIDSLNCFSLPQTPKLKKTKAVCCRPLGTPDGGLRHGI